MAKKKTRTKVFHLANGIKQEIWYELVGPQKAQLLKKNMAPNRKLKTRWVAAYAQAMKNGHWIEFNGDAICLNNKGQLEDGQQRLSGVILSGAKLWFMFIKGVPENSRNAKDSGASRNLRDLLGMNGEKYCGPLKGALNELFKFKIDLLQSKDSAPILTDYTTILKLLKTNPLLRESAQKGYELKKKSPVSLISEEKLAFLHYVLRSIDSKEGNKFLQIITYQESTQSKKKPSNDY